MKITCPIRKNLCHETASNLEKNAKFMVKKYNKQKKFKVAGLKEGDHVSVAIPKSLRNSTDMLRLPCVVLHKSFGENPTYKLVTSHGVLEKRFNATNLMPYSSIVKVKSDANVSLSEAVLNEITSKVVFCRCKKAKPSTVNALKMEHHVSHDVIKEKQKIAKTTTPIFLYRVKVSQMKP
ncbi:uncharacterized protein LOC136095180 isoform X1 [Hydra vulgaris]|uniref:uncharacterized protein LOC136095180 isoform X1 n=1 Tax=Hydra vulgaris TaxID=6087 RepID=UPI0032EA3964